MRRTAATPSAAWQRLCWLAKPPSSICPACCAGPSTARCAYNLFLRFIIYLRAFVIPCLTQHVGQASGGFDGVCALTF